MFKLESHSSAMSGTQHGPVSWTSLWALPAPPGGKSSRLPILMELPDMNEEEVDVQEACDAGLVDREDLVNERSKHSFPLLYCSYLHIIVLLHELLPPTPAYPLDPLAS